MISSALLRYSSKVEELVKGPLHYNKLAQRSLCVWRYFDIRLYMLVCIEGRQLNGDQWFNIVYSSLKNEPILWCSHSASKIFACTKKFEVGQ